MGKTAVGHRGAGAKHETLRWRRQKMNTKLRRRKAASHGTYVSERQRQTDRKTDRQTDRQTEKRGRHRQGGKGNKTHD